MRQLYSMLATAVPIMITGLFSFGRAADQSANWTVPSAEAQNKNPVPADPKSVARGKALYSNNCLVCHGPAGKGDGTRAREMNLKPSDLSSSHIAAQSDGTLHWKITTGLKPMPAFQKDLSDEDRRHIVNYLRTLGPAPRSQPAESANGGSAQSAGQVRASRPARRACTGWTASSHYTASNRSSRPTRSSNRPASNGR